MAAARRFNPMACMFKPPDPLRSSPPGARRPRDVCAHIQPGSTSSTSRQQPSRGCVVIRSDARRRGRTRSGRAPASAPSGKRQGVRGGCSWPRMAPAGKTTVWTFT
jgi:hypothetical protein